MAQIDKLTTLFGGVTRFADEIGISHGLIAKWRQRSSLGRKPGHVPSRYNAAVLKAAKRLGLNMADVLDCLNDHHCPLCDQQLPEGVNIGHQWMRKRPL